jgi:hypothetical protein
MKAGHGIDMEFTWKRAGGGTGTLIQIEGEKEKSLSEKMFGSWVAFARTGSPDFPGLPKWPLYNESTRETMVFNLESEVQLDPQKDRRIWETVTSKAAYNDVVLAMQNDMFSQEDAKEQDATDAADLPQKDGYYSVHDKIGDLMKNKETEVILYTLEDAFKSPGGKVPKMNKAMMGMLSKMTLVKLVTMMGSKFPQGALAGINDKLMKVKK